MKKKLAILGLLSLISTNSFGGTCRVYSIMDHNTKFDMRAQQTSITNTFNENIPGDVAYSAKINKYGAVLSLTDWKTDVTVITSTHAKQSALATADIMYSNGRGVQLECFVGR